MAAENTPLLVPDVESTYISRDDQPSTNAVSKLIASMHSKEEALASLKQHDVGDKFSEQPAMPKASVLVPLFMGDGGLRTLMTLRSQELRRGAGEVCFPGGKRDPSDRDEVDTALREAEEEIGLPPEDVQVVCRLPPFISKFGLLVTPVVGFISDTFRPRPNPAEVSAVFTVPLDFFTCAKDHSSSRSTSERRMPMHSFHYLDPDTGSQYRIWGLTALFAILVATLALKKKPEFDIGVDWEELPNLLQQYLHRHISKL